MDRCNCTYVFFKCCTDRVPTQLRKSVGKKMRVASTPLRRFVYRCKCTYVFQVFAYTCIHMFLSISYDFGVPEAPGGTPGGLAGPLWQPRWPQRPFGDEFSSILDVILRALGEPGEHFLTTQGSLRDTFSIFGVSLCVFFVFRICYKLLFTLFRTQHHRTK